MFLLDFILLAQLFLYFYTIFKRIHKKYMLASVLVFLVGFVSMAQDIPQPPAPPNPPGLPIDGGIVFLFLLALGYGIYKSYKISKRSA